MKLSKTAWWIIGSCSAVGLTVGAYFLFRPDKPKGYDKYGNKKLKTKGAKDDSTLEGGVQTTKEPGTAIYEPDWDNPYDMNYTKDVKDWLSPKRIEIYPSEDALDKAQELINSYGGAWYNDDNEDAVEQVFKSLPDKVAVARVAQGFFLIREKAGAKVKDMWEFLTSFLSDDEMNEYVYTHVKALPNYRLKS